MANEQYTSPNMSRSEEIVRATIDGTEYNKPPQSRLETLLIELKEAVEAGSGESSDYATALSLTIDSSTYVITARLLNKDGDTLGTAQTIDLPIESVVVSGSYDSQTKKVILTLQSGSTIEFSVADLVSGLQTEITSNNKLSADLVDDTNTTHKFVTASDKTTWNNKQNVLTVGTNLDDEPIEDSTNPITSGGVYNTVGNLDAALDSLIMSLEPKTITANGTYDPTDDGVDGYSSVGVDVANSYSQSDNGKVVSNQTLVSQTAYPTEITENDTYDTTNYNSITVNVSGGGGLGGTDVVFYDYDGSVVASYSAADFANLSAMPANPTHTGLTSQGWNWSLADAKTYVAAYGKLNIGQMYITSDGKTRLYYVIPKNNLTLELYLTLDSDTELDIDWGDNSEHATWTSEDGDSSKSHEYSDGGRYTVAITVVSGGFSYQDYGNENYNLKNVEFGSSVTSIVSSAFYYCYALSSITIPNSVTSIGENAFDSCCALSSITIPSSVVTIEKRTFTSCYALSSITIPNSVESIGENAFYYCHALSSITIPSNVTSIESEVFYGCHALSSLTIPSNVTSIERDAFTDCSALTSITFESTTPPDLYGGLGIPTPCVIRVPQGTLSDYTSASNYPDPNDYIYVEY